VIRIRRGADPDLIVRLPDGHHAAIAMSCTDYAASDNSTSFSTTDHLLDFHGLRQVAQLIEQIHQKESHAPITAEQASGFSEE
jgi:hypothetical protein